MRLTVRDADRISGSTKDALRAVYALIFRALGGEYNALKRQLLEGTGRDLRHRRLPIAIADCQLSIAEFLCPVFADSQSAIAMEIVKRTGSH